MSLGLTETNHSAATAISEVMFTIMIGNDAIVMFNRLNKKDSYREKGGLIHVGYK
ncbi:hypothetical protein NQ117_14355 [Paenibacillus sp. SC116]|nr:hypothetical protein [Paenibacillus sp. SC116]